MKYPLYRDTLCPKLWNINEDGAKLDNIVRKGLYQIAQDFVANLKKENNIHIKIHDIVIIGSITNYNWTDYSDIDLHVVTDFKDLDMTADDAQTLFDAIKVGWNNKHNITMKGHDVEIYVQDTAHVPTSASSYSVLKNDWIQEPVKESPTFNKGLIKKKYKEYKKKITTLLSKHDETALKSLLDKLYKYRQSGLDKGGELSEENIVFKIIRAYGYLDKIKDNIAKNYDDKMSVKEIALNKSEYESAVDDVVDEIYQYAKKYKKYPDINPSLEKLVGRFNIDIEQAYSDVARGFHQMIQEALKENAVPNDADTKDQVHVFDFDDTLGITDNPNGIMLYKDGQPAHKDVNTSMQWVRAAGLEKHLVPPKGKSSSIIMSTDPKRRGAIFYVDSSGLARVTKLKTVVYDPSKGEPNIPNQGEVALIDFTPSSDVDLSTTKPIKSTIDKLKSLNSTGAKTAVMTARQGSGGATGLDGKTLNVTNEKDIQKFLASKGAAPNSGIVGVKGKDKGEEIEKKFISSQKDNPPKEIHFYDDSSNNTINVSRLGGKIPSELYIYGPGHFSDGSVNPNTPNQSFSEKDANKKEDEKKRVSEVVRKMMREEIRRKNRNG